MNLFEGELLKICLFSKKKRSYANERVKNKSQE